MRRWARFTKCILGRVTPIVPRFSATLVEPKVQRWLGQYGITVSGRVRRGPRRLRQTLASRTLPAVCRRLSNGRSKSVEESFSGLKEALAKLDPTLVEASQTGASKMHYQLDRLRERAMAAELRRSEVVSRHAEALSQALYPDGALQERGVAGTYFVARHGIELLRSIYRDDAHRLPRPSDFGVVAKGQVVFRGIALPAHGASMPTSLSLPAR